MSSHVKSNYCIRSLSNAIDLLEQFQGDVSELGLTDLSRSLRLTKNNIFRLLATLQSRNYIEQNASTGKYRLGFRTVELGQHCARQLGALKMSRLIMEEMVRECNETVCISVMRDFSIINLDAIECNHPLRVIPRIGVPLPAYCTAAGKAQIAYYSDDKLGKYFSHNKFQKYTSKTIVTQDDFMLHLREVAQNGYAIELEELDLGVTCIGASIRNYTTNIVGAVTCLGPTDRFTDNRMRNELIPLVTKGAADISNRLGYY